MLAHAHPAVAAIHTKKPSITSEGLPSPTLTNPDMILPSQNNESEPSTPTRYTSIAPPSPSNMRLLETFATRSPKDSFSSDSAPQPDAQRFGSPRVLRYQHGGPLSDIDEERTPVSERGFFRNSVLPSSPTVSVPLANLESHNQLRPPSSGSSSTASAGSGLTEWLKADEEVAQTGGSDIGEDYDRGSDQEEDDDKLAERSSLASTAEDDFALTHKAESILANAKKRLTNMESHLNRARTSLLESPPPFSPINGEFRLAGGLYRSISQGEERKWDSSSRTPRKIVLASQHKSPGHSRVFSDPAINPQNKTFASPGFRSASAMETGYGSSIDALLHKDSPESGSNSNQTRSPASGSTYTFNTPLRALEEDDAEKEVNPQSSVASMQTTGLGILNARSMESFPSKQSISELSSVPTRSNSQLSTHDIRNQMISLRDRISSLKTRTQEDTLRRRSMQNVRPSSSYTVAEQWYTSAPEYRESGSPLNTNAGLGWSPTQEQLVEESHHRPSAIEPSTSPPPIAQDVSLERDVQTALTHREIPIPPPNNGHESLSAHYHQRTDSQDLGEDSIKASDEEQIYLNEALEESLHEGDESYGSPEFMETAPQPERHEDRADAFDYEHFFLHSAIGNYSSLDMHRRNSSRASVASADSVVTTRAANPTGEEDLDTPRGSTVQKTSFASHGRNNSVDSVSTMATFQTATEGDGLDDEDQDNETSNALVWGGHRPMPGSMDSSQYLPLTRSTMVSKPRSRTPTTISSHDANANATILPNGSLPTPPITSPRSPTSPVATYVDVLSFLRSINPTRSILPLRADDTELAIDLLKSLDIVCAKMAKDSGAEGIGTRYENRTFRRRLDAARRVLDGALEVDGL